MNNLRKCQNLIRNLMSKIVISFNLWWANGWRTERASEWEMQRWWEWDRRWERRNLWWGEMSSGWWGEMSSGWWWEMSSGWWGEMNSWREMLSSRWEMGSMGYVRSSNLCEFQLRAVRLGTVDAFEWRSRHLWGKQLRRRHWKGSWRRKRQWWRRHWRNRNRRRR